jgi:hypothetical protein
MLHVCIMHVSSMLHVFYLCMLHVCSMLHVLFFFPCFFSLGVPQIAYVRKPSPRPSSPTPQPTTLNPQPSTLTPRLCLWFRLPWSRLRLVVGGGARFALTPQPKQAPRPTRLQYLAPPHRFASCGRSFAVSLSFLSTSPSQTCRDTHACNTSSSSAVEDLMETL